jgi:osmotically-inducible protein OsmY
MEEAEMKAYLIAGGVLGALLISGCSPANEQQVNQQVQGVRQQVGQAANEAQRAAANATLAAKVKNAITTRKGMSGVDVKVDAREGTVVLKGDVKAPEQARTAEDVARNTEGVTTVENHLMVRVPASSVPSGTAPPGPDSSTTPEPTTPGTTAPSNAPSGT